MADFTAVELLAGGASAASLLLAFLSFRQSRERAQASDLERVRKIVDDAASDVRVLKETVRREVELSDKYRDTVDRKLTELLKEIYDVAKQRP